MTPAELITVPGVAECRLGEATVAALPSEAPPAPWAAECSAIVWYGRGGAAASRAAGVAAEDGQALATIGGLVSYSNTPVGSYHEVFGTVAVRTGRAIRGTIPFMAVDSLASLVGGRQNWSLPKCPAAFTGEPAISGSTTAMTAEGDGWFVRASARPFGPSYRVPMRARMVQPWPDGLLRDAALDGSSRSRSAIVTVEVRSRANLASWLRPGRHLGAVLTGASFTLGIPEAG